MITFVAGGSGIHRPVSRAASVKSMKIKKKSSSIMSTTSYGTEYRSKKARGDVKRKGMPDPYAYLPLTRNVLNKRWVNILSCFLNFLKIIFRNI